MSDDFMNETELESEAGEDHEDESADIKQLRAEFKAVSAETDQLRNQLRSRAVADLNLSAGVAKLFANFLLEHHPHEVDPGEVHRLAVEQALVEPPELERATHTSRGEQIPWDDDEIAEVNRRALIGSHASARQPNGGRA